MSTRWLDIITPNLVAWSLQIALVALAAAAWPLIFRMKAARARLWFWQILLGICLVLPLVQPWVKPSTILSSVTFTTGPLRVAPTQTHAGFHISWPGVVVIVLCAGIVLRLSWLALGLVRLRSYRKNAAPFASSTSFEDLRRSIAPEAEILLSSQVSSPVTFGVWNPVVLLPERVDNLDAGHCRSIICHELIHIRRRDWAVAIVEELVRTAVWFHPAVWWMLGRIQLSREQVVDEAVIEHTGDRSRYLDALLAIASFRLRADLAPAPLFLKKRHLRQRVESIVSGVQMTKRTLLVPLAAALATLPVVIGIAAWQFPLRAAPQEAVDDNGVEIQAGAVKVLHRTGIAFPDSAHARHLSGTVVVNVSVDENGEVTGAHAISGPDEFRKAVVQSILNWHFSMDGGTPRTFDVAVKFNDGQATDQAPANPSLFPPNAEDASRTIDSISLTMLPAGLREKVTQSGLLHTGDAVTRDKIKTLEASLRNIDDHLRIIGVIQNDKVHVMVQLANPTVAPRKGTRVNAAGVSGGALTLSPAAAAGNATVTVSSSQAIRVGGNVQAANLIRQIKPAYPPMAKQARIQGTVRFNTTIGADGFVKNLVVDSGHPMLVAAAMEAVKQWIYKPTLLNGNPVEVVTTVDVNFTLSDGPPAAQPQEQ